MTIKPFVHAISSALLMLIVVCSVWAAPKEVVLYNFNGGTGDGAKPVGGLIADKAGNLYGTTGTGGPYTDCSPFGQTCGTVFELSPSNGSWTETILYTFTGGSDGGEPLAGLVMDNSGNLYGTTAIGGDFGFGTVFELSKSNGGWSENVLYSFQGGLDGAYPQSSVTLHGNYIVGMTYAGGGNQCIDAPSGCGTIFQLVHGQNGWTENVLWRFASGSDGAFPYASLIVDAAGNLYGTTSQGGYLQDNCAPYGCGNVFQLNRTQGGWNLNPIHEFTSDTDGASPYAGLLPASGNTAYGTAASGGTGFGGTVYSLQYSGGSWVFNVLYSFSGPDGSAPEGALIAKGNNLFGTTYSGGSGSGCFFGGPCGTVFMLTKTQSGWKQRVLHSFTANGTDGVYPEDGLILTKNGLLATTNAGGTSDKGTVFAIVP